MPSGSIDQALVGKIAGAQISSVDGTPGARTNILLRGINSLQAGTRPMILIDGIEDNYYFEYAQGTDETVDIIQNIQAAYHVNRFLDLEAVPG